MASIKRTLKKITVITIKLKYNIYNDKNDGRDSPWRQYKRTGFTINENFRARKTDHGGNLQFLSQHTDIVKILQV